MTERPEEIWERRIREALDRVPGYRGYRLKEERRDADRRVRAAVADAYAAELARVERIGRDLANARRLGEISAVERTSQAIRHYIDRVRSATPATAGCLATETSTASRSINCASSTRACSLASTSCDRRSTASRQTLPPVGRSPRQRTKQPGRSNHSSLASIPGKR